MKHLLVWFLILTNLLFINLPCRADDEQPSDERLSAPDSFTFVSHYKREKKFKMLVELLEGELAKIDHDCATAAITDSCCDLEGRLYILDELAETYTYGLIDFNKASDYNEKAKEAEEALLQAGLSETEISQYYSDQRFLYYCEYYEGGMLDIFSDSNAAFDQSYMDYVRRDDLERLGKRIRSREIFLNRKLHGAQEEAFTPPKNVDIDLYMAFMKMIDDSSYSPFEKGFYKAEIAAKALMQGGQDMDIYLATILEAEPYGRIPDSDDDLNQINQINILNYWLAMTHKHLGDTAKAIKHHEYLLAGIGKLDGALKTERQQMAKMLENYYREEMADSNALKNTGKQILSGLASVVTVLFKVGLSATALVADAYSFSQGMYSHLFADSISDMWMDSEWDWGVYDSVMTADFLNPEYNWDDSDSRQFERFMSPYALALNRYLNKHDLLKYLDAIGDCYVAQNELQKASCQYEEAVNIIEHQRITISSEATRVAFFGFSQNLYAKLIRVLVEQGQFDEAFQYVERSKARAFLDVLGSEENIVLKSSRQNELSRSSQTNLAEIDTILDVGEASDDQLAHVAEKTRGLAVVQNDVDNNSCLEIYSLSSVNAVSSLEMMGQLDSDTNIIEYYTTNDKIYYFIANKDSLNVREVEMDYETLTSLVQSLNRSIISGEFDQEASAELRRILIGDIEDGITGSRLVIIPHKILHYVPFQCLRSDDGYLIEKYALSYAPSATVLQIVNEKTVTDGEGALVLGNPTGDLEYADQEAQAIGRVLTDSKVLLHSKATETQLKNEASGYKVIHVASHGVFDAANPLDSKILLSADQENDGNLETHEMFACDWHASLVALSACQTGLSRYMHGDELIGLQRGVFYAGTQSLLASAWKVNDESTGYLMESFYTHLQEDPKDIALQKAQLDTMRKFPEPMNWAAFNMIGAANWVYNEPFHLKVVVRPSDAEVTICDLEDEYRSGMLLPQGTYTVLVSKDGYDEVIKEIEIADHDVEIKVALVASKTPEEESKASEADPAGASAAGSSADQAQPAVR